MNRLDVLGEMIFGRTLAEAEGKRRRRRWGGKWAERGVRGEKIET